jgi:hypothetical protein
VAALSSALISPSSVKSVIWVSSVIRPARPIPSVTMPVTPACP